jgi:hypothetical protein
MKERGVSTTCVVCQLTNSKYKCPKCRQHYCSVKCCAEHKKVDCTISANNPFVPDDNNRTDVTRCGESGRKRKANELYSNDRPKVDFPDEFVVITNEQKRRLLESSDLKSMMKSERLREDLKAIDAAPNRLQALRDLRQRKPEFQTVVDAILNSIQ